MSARNLRSLFDPAAVAVVGASDDPGKWGHWLARGALSGRARRAVRLVNRSGGKVLGERAHASLAELDVVPELVVLAVPLAGFDAALEDALAKGARAIVAVNAGFGEAGADGLAHQQAIAARVRAAGALLVGPNCLGVADTSTDLRVAWLPVPGGIPAPGPLTVISQSGNTAVDVVLHARDAGLGLARFVSIGNQADLELADVLRACADHAQTEAVAVYCEDVRDGRALFDAAAAVVASGRHVLLLAAGGSEASARAAQSHTGALTSDPLLLDAACEATGAIRVGTPGQLVDVAHALLRGGRPPGRRLGIVSDGGGHAALTADAAVAAGLEVPPLRAATGARLRAVLHETASADNPVDLAASNVEVDGYERAASALVESGDVDAVLLVGGVGGFAAVAEGAADGAEAGELLALARQEEASLRRLAERAAAHGVPVAMQTIYPDTAGCRATRAAGIAVYRDVAAAVGALGRAAAASPGRGVPALPAAVPETAVDGYFGARALLAAEGIPFAAAREVRDEREALAAGAELGYPVALKAVGLLHKSDAGGVALGLADEAALRATFARMDERLGAGVRSVERMADVGAGVELIVGCRNDARFGPVLLVGLGGVFAEVLAVVRLLLAPVDAEEVACAMAELRGAALLRGARGRPAVDVAAAAAVAARLSEVVAARPWLASVELNPLLATATGALALDARALRAGEDR